MFTFLESNTTPNFNNVKKKLNFLKHNPIHRKNSRIYNCQYSSLLNKRVSVEKNPHDCCLEVLNLKMSLQKSPLAKKISLLLNDYPLRTIIIGIINGSI